MFWESESFIHIDLLFNTFWRCHCFIFYIKQDERLHSGDHILQIGDVDVRGFGSEQVAQVLRQAGSHVRLIVARPINEPQGIPTPGAPIVPTIQLDQHLEQIMSMLEKQDQMLIENQLDMENQQNLMQKEMLERAEIHQVCSISLE